MIYGLSDNQIGTLHSIFGQYPNIDQVILYGSRAKGNYKPGSDIDLTVKGEYISIDLLNAIKTQISNSTLPYLVDLSNYKELSNIELIEHINKVGIVFYQRPKGSQIYSERIVALLQEASQRLSDSIYQDTVDPMNRVMRFVADNLPFVALEAKRITRQIKNRKGEYILSNLPDLSLLDQDVRDNAMGYLFAINGFIKESER